MGEPLHLSNQGVSRRLVSGSKDGDVRVWDVVLAQCLRSLTSHTASVTSVRWGGAGLIYSASQDRTIKVWRAKDEIKLDGPKLKALAEKRYNDVMKVVGEELLVSGSDDFTMFMWKPEHEKKSVARMTGHQQLVNDVKFSPDMRLVASASFDKSIRIWCGKTGKYIAVFRGHVQSVYQLAWSADSRLLVSGSADSTLKLWSMDTKKLHTDLPGHGDEVYTVDWSPDGQRVVSGGKDRVLRIWR